MSEAAASGRPLIEVRNLSVRYGGRREPAVRDISFAIGRGEIFGLVGESGSGKSTVGRQFLGERGAKLLATGSVLFDDHGITGMSERDLRAIRGARIAFVPQNPTTALNPVIRVGDQIAEILRVHRKADTGATIAGQVQKLLLDVRLPNPHLIARRYPSQLSGGQQQRVAIAMAVACSPDIVVLDEPTTGLDVTTQRQIVDLLAGLRRSVGMSMLYITHDLMLLRELADRIGVMYAGRLVEVASTETIFEAPAHPYTQGLTASIPGIVQPRFAKLAGILDRRQIDPQGCPFAPRCVYAEDRCRHDAATLLPVREASGHHVACWKFDRTANPVALAAPISLSALRKVEAAANALSVENLTIRYGAGKSTFTAVKSVGFAVRQAEIFALIGESGSGKSSLARAVCGGVPFASGDVRLGTERLSSGIRGRTAEQARKIQYIFQNPDASLNPRMSVRQILQRPLDRFFALSQDEALKQIYAILEQVGLDASYAGRWPGELSGGERQRVAIARALLAKPQFLICDEILSALDVSVQARILDLLTELRQIHRLGMLFISHDLSVVRLLADRIGVLLGGEIVAEGSRSDIFDHAEHPYVKQLIAAAPGHAPAPELQGLKQAGAGTSAPMTTINGRTP